MHSSCPLRATVLHHQGLRSLMSGPRVELHSLSLMVYGKGLQMLGKAHPENILRAHPDVYNNSLRIEHT